MLLFRASRRLFLGKKATRRCMLRPQVLKLSWTGRKVESLVADWTSIYMNLSWIITFTVLKFQKLFFIFFLFHRSHGNNFNPNRRVIAVCFEWVTGSWAPFNCCRLVKISYRLLSVTWMRSQRRPQRASRRRFLLSVNLHHPPSACSWFSHFPELWKVCFFHIFFSSTEAFNSHGS